MNIKEAIKELKGSYELHQCEWAKRCLNTIEEELEKKDSEIENLKQEIEDCKKCVIRDDIHNYIEELEKKDRIINKMAERITTDIHSKEWVIDFYEREVER